MVPIKEISDYIHEGKRIQAVKLVRESTGCSLKDAKDYVDELERVMKKSSIKTNQIHYVSDVSAIDGMEGHEFEYFCAELLQKVGFSEVTVTPGSGDQGVDILAVKDSVKYAIQCKNYASALSNTPIQEVSAGKQFYGCHVGVVMTNSTFTPGAIQLATATNVLLWDRTKLDELISKAGGLESLGICPGYIDCDSDNDLEEIFDDSFEDCIDESENNGTGTNAGSPRKSMRILSKICMGWSVICVLMLLLMFIGDDEQDAMTYTGMFLGEGFFVFVLGLMFGTLAKTKKGDSYIHLGGRSIKKVLFVIVCIVIAYVLFIGTMGITGGLNITTS